MEEGAMGRNPTLRESMAVLVERTENIQGDVGEIKEAVSRLEEHQYHHQDRISRLEGRLTRPKLAVGGLSGGAAIYGILELLKALGWF